VTARLLQQFDKPGVLSEKASVSQIIQALEGVTAGIPLTNSQPVVCVYSNILN